jgi:5-methylcytosine-specific restriction enzyme subunit McrC
MVKDKSIVISNIYYMLSYAYRNLQQSNYEEIKTESFENVQDLFAAILAKGMMAQLKQGLSRKYIEKQDVLSTLRGKIDIRESMLLKARDDLRLSCHFDELSENHYMNQILKTTALCLIRSDGVKRENKDRLKKPYRFLTDVDTLEPSAINWRGLYYNRNNASYRMLMNICYLVLHVLLLTTENGKHRLATFLDDQQMSLLYEKFILEYYKAHYAAYNPTSKQIDWDTEGATDFLPKMQSDTMLSDSASKKKLIIDAKYYTRIMQSHHESEKIRSSHLYQIFSYVKNEDKGQTGLVGGILLYAKTSEDSSINQDYELSGNRISVRTLDLNMSFAHIRKQLDRLIEECFGLQGGTND